MKEYKYLKSVQSGGKRSAAIVASMALTNMTLELLPIVGRIFTSLGVSGPAQVIAISGVYGFFLATFLNWLKKRHGIDFWAIVGNLKP